MTTSRCRPSCHQLKVQTLVLYQDFYWSAGPSSIISHRCCSRPFVYIFPISRSFTPSSCSNRITRRSWDSQAKTRFRCAVEMRNKCRSPQHLPPSDQTCIPAWRTHQRRAHIHIWFLRRTGSNRLPTHSHGSTHAGVASGGSSTRRASFVCPPPGHRAHV